jgi:hypothetical protein
MDRKLSGADAKHSLDRKLRRMLAFGWAVMRHGWALTVTLLGSAVLSIPSWIEPLLSPMHARRLSELLTISPHAYQYIAAGFFVLGLLYACFLAWNEERDEIERLMQQAGAPHDSPAQQENTDAISRLTWEMKVARWTKETQKLMRPSKKKDDSSD